ncbi:hypothetical protein TVAG_182550 [Trichomonas vaginalis G3]|uniref:receptor protein-tyrosine kinase n=1 Tax=Trichomonas vaginalis (strain ATCC PRA-98 / G3) TaxID=412133 RepID=A2D8Z3_TRIV3|nr:serine-type endopeptidase protein [Trichomonas vaginalis G3]EAY23019.1 hypothetical protein TVAG_182550 [Trichomonas vaginalis G3]KAI5518982.1 serine-type endopeptidase protein [Trichomonas vaginalis G3]|eukprot:XP_001584005.1 hypothetical protein [Trichomonas vaginalis G3]
MLPILFLTAFSINYSRYSRESTVVLSSKTWSSSGTYQAVLYPGTYTFTAKGASGGIYNSGSSPGEDPGLGAHITGIYNYEGQSALTFEIIVGGDGQKGTAGYSNGGSAGTYTGKSGLTTNSGAGGGSSGIYLDSSPIIVAAGGSGSVNVVRGAPGGCGNNVYHIIWNSGYYEEEVITDSASVVDCSGSGKDGTSGTFPGSGGGGGILCGKGGSGQSSISASLVGYGGKSYMPSGFTCTPGHKTTENSYVTITPYSCTSPCQICYTNSTCTKCNDGYKLYKGSCVTSCPYGTDTDGNCVVCPTGCSSCSSSTQCTSCSSGYYLYESSCLTSCPLGFYASGSICQSCDSSCTACTSSTVCSACASGKKFYKNQCLSNHPDGTYKSNSNCIECSSNCLLCMDSTTCSKCESGFYLYNSSCHSSCPSGTYASNSSCENCPDHCTSCEITKSLKCTKCEDKYHLFSRRCINETLYNQLNSPELDIHLLNYGVNRRKVGTKERFV